MTIRNGSNEHTFFIYDGFEIGGRNGTIIASFIETEYFNVNPIEHPWINSCNTFIDDTFEITLVGTVAKRGYTDITLKKINSNNHKETLLEKFHIESFGFQIQETKIIGKMLQNKKLRCALPDSIDNKSYWAT